MNKPILLIEDDDYFSSVIKIHLDKQGLEVHIAPDAETGLELLPQVKPALVLLDVMLPGMDGFAACLKIKSDPQLKNIPVIMLTGKSKIKDIDKGFEVGADDYITKSSAIHILLKTLTAKIEQYST